MNCPSLGTLHAYAAEDNYQGCEECLNRGDDVNSMAQDPLNPSSPAGETPLHIAARYGRYNIFMLLLNHGGDRSIKNAAGQTPLDVCSEQFRIQVQSALRPKKAPPKRLAPPSAPPMRAQGNTSELPKGWIFARDRRTGRPYYIHLPTRTSQVFLSTKQHLIYLSFLCKNNFLYLISSISLFHSLSLISFF